MRHVPIVYCSGRRSPFLSLAWLLLLCSVATLTAAWTVQKVTAALCAVYPLSLQSRLRIAQGATSCGAFLLGPLAYWYAFERSTPQAFFLSKAQERLKLAVLSISLVSAAMVVAAGLAVVNQSIVLPDKLATWAQAREQAVEQLVNQLARTSDVSGLLLNFMLMAALPAVGEEFTFRGVMQNLCHKAYGNMHVAVFVSALAFSALHLQPYTFLPRVGLGVLFGYLYWGTRDLRFPIMAHFVNNACMLTALFLENRSPNTTPAALTSHPKAAIVAGACFAVPLVYVLGRILHKHVQGARQYVGS